jgi:hypothetical protein
MFVLIITSSLSLWLLPLLPFLLFAAVGAVRRCWIREGENGHAPQ